MSCDPVNSGFEEYGREDQCSLQCFGVHESFFDLLILFMLFVCVVLTINTQILQLDKFGYDLALFGAKLFDDLPLTV